MLRLDIQQKNAGSTEFESPKSAVFIGRDQSMDVVLADPLVSRQHAVIIARGSEFVLQDVGGRNPIRVNGQETLSRVLVPGDRIEIGQTTLVFNESEADEQQASEDLAPTVVDSRRSLEHFLDSGEFPSPPPDDTVSGVSLFARPVEQRSRRNLRILEGFCGLIRNLSDRRRVLRIALDTVFDTLDVKRGIIGFFSPSGQLEIETEKNENDRKHVSYSRSFVDRVRTEGIAVLFSEVGKTPRARASLTPRVSSG